MGPFHVGRSQGILFLAVILAALQAHGQVSVLTQHNDNSRTGQNLQETALTTSTVNVSNFGKLFALPVDSNIYVQPLYVPNLTIGSTTHNVVYVATAQNSVYAFDADSGNTTPLWVVSLGTPVPAQDICVTDPAECPYTDVIPVIGIVATPVIDAENGTIYVVANTKDTSSPNYHFKLHALDLKTGAEKFGGPTEIAATGFAAFTELNHPGLLLVNGTIYLGFGSVGDFPTWHGYVISYDATTLQQVAVFNSTPQSNSVGGAGIWQTGNGLVADANGNIYAVTSNGNFDVNTGGKDFGSAYLKLNGSTLSVQDYFVPYNASYLNLESNNVDLGSGGPLLIPNTTLLVGGGKDAVLRVVDTSNMGKFNSVQDSNHQNLIGATNPPIFGSPVYWNSPNGPLIYMWGQNDFAKAWSFNAQTSMLSTAPVMESTVQDAKGWNDQAALSISANGSTAGTGILWASMPYSGISNPGPVPGILYALDATNLTTELWDSQMNASHDSVGNYAKFVPPTVVNGKVYLATFSGQLLVYGPIDFALTAAPQSQSIKAGNSASYVVYANPQGGYTGTVSLSCPGTPSGITCAFTQSSLTLTSGGGQVNTGVSVSAASSVAAGNYNVTVQGTAGNRTHTTTIGLTVTAAPSFTMMATALTPASISPGGAATSTVTLTPVGGFNSTVNLTCVVSSTPAASLPPTCSLSSATVNGGNGTPTLTVSTVAATASLSQRHGIYYAMLLPLCGMTLLGASFTSRRRKLLGALLVCLMLSGVIFLEACGGGTSGGGGGGGNPGTTAGSYTVTVTGTSGSQTQTQSLSVTVQ